MAAGLEELMKAPEAEVQLASGAVVGLATLWAEEPLALVFLRHYG
jgi:predicted dinucleotide-utilizing enzyme